MTKRMRLVSLRIPEDIYEYYSSLENASEAMRYALVTYASTQNRKIQKKYEQFELPL